MYIYRAVKRGKSLQEGANHLRVLQRPATASLWTPNSWAGHPLKRQGTKTTVDSAAPLRPAGT